MAGNLLDQIEASGKVAAAAAALYASVRTMFPLYKRLKARHDSRVARDRALDEMLDLVRKMHEELRPNSGKTIRDSLDRIEVRQVVSEQRWRITIFDHERGIIEFTERGKLAWANRTFRELTGRDQEQLLDDGWINALQHDTREQVLAEWQACVEQQRDYETTLTVQRTDNTAIAACFRATSLKLPTEMGRRKTDHEGARGWVGILTPCDACPASVGCQLRSGG